MVGGVDAFLVVIAALDRERAFLAAGLAILGSIIGSLILFFAARRGGQLYLNRYTSGRKGMLLRQWFQRYGLLTVFIPALVPIPLPLKIFILSAGAIGVSPITFTLVLLAARVPRYAGLAYLGAQLGEGTLPYLRTHMWHLVATSIVLFLVLYLALRLYDRRRDSAADLM